jgi:hypothetical protein
VYFNLKMISHNYGGEVERRENLGGERSGKVKDGRGEKN